MEEEKEKKGGYGYGGHHVLALPYPSQGHINPMLQFCKRLLLSSKAKSINIKTTFLLTNFISNSSSPSCSSSVQFDTISDGFDQGGFQQAADDHVYLTTLQQAGSQSLSQLINKYKTSPHPVTSIIYDSFLPWALDVAKDFGLVGASFFTQPCAVNYIYYYAHHGMLSLPLLPSSSSLPVSIPGMPLLQLQDMPSFIYKHGTYPAYFHLVLNQFSNLHKADYVIVNTFYKLEDEVVDAMSKISPLMTIGPTVPSSYLDDDRVEDDDDYGLHLYHLNESSAVCNWLNSKPTGSVVFVSFGSMACLGVDQMEELAWGLRGLIGKDDYYYLWVVRASEEGKVPEKFKQETSAKGLLVSWSPQMQVLSSKAVGCFFSHAGWNSTVEALSLGVPMVVMPQWTDQTTNAKFVQDVWKVGIRVKVDTKSGLVGRQEIETCTREVMEGEGGKEMKKNALKWRDLAKEAVREGGTTDKNIDQFVSELSAATL